MVKKYSVSYTSGATGYGWEEDCNTIQEVKNLISEIKDSYTSHVYVYDRILNDFIFYKFCLNYKPETDLIYSSYNDLRTKDKMRK